MSFSPWSYADQLRKYDPENAEKYLRVYGWVSTKTRKRTKPKLEPRQVICQLCEGVFITKTRASYCKKNAQGKNCSQINKSMKWLLRSKLRRAKQEQCQNESVTPIQLAS